MKPIIEKEKYKEFVRASRIGGIVIKIEANEAYPLDKTIDYFFYAKFIRAALSIYCLPIHKYYDYANEQGNLMSILTTMMHLGMPLESTRDKKYLQNEMKNLFEEPNFKEVVEIYTYAFMIRELGREGEEKHSLHLDESGMFPYTGDK